MVTILDRLPIPSQDDIVFVREEMVRIKAYEVIVWVSLRAGRSPQWDPATPRFPAILDTAHTHNCSIQEQHLVCWAGLQPGLLRVLGNVRQAGQPASLYAADLWIHRNRPGERDRFLDRPPYRLELPRGIIVSPSTVDFPRLPLVGLRALISNQLYLIIDGARQQAHLRAPRRWRFPW